MFREIISHGKGSTLTSPALFDFPRETCWSPRTDCAARRAKGDRSARRSEGREGEAVSVCVKAPEDF